MYHSLLPWLKIGHDSSSYMKQLFKTASGSKSRNHAMTQRHSFVCNDILREEF